MKKLLSSEELDGRLNCFGEFDAKDKVCLRRCALSINCAIAKNEYFTLQIIDDSLSNAAQYENDFN